MPHHKPDVKAPGRFRPKRQEGLGILNPAMREGADLFAEVRSDAEAALKLQPATRRVIPDLGLFCHFTGTPPAGQHITPRHPELGRDTE